MPDTKKEPPAKQDFVKIKHKKSNDFITQLATGFVIFGPDLSGNYSIIFHREGYEVNHEIYQLNRETDEYERYRFDENLYKEDFARIIVPKEKLFEMKAIIDDMLSKTS